MRSADNLRPDEAFDELVKLYRAYVGSSGGKASPDLLSSFDLRLSNTAMDIVIPALWELLDEASDGLGADVFQELADVGVRSGLGQYFTPSPVADAMADYLAPVPGESWMDPFVGSGLLLGAIAVAAKGRVTLHGSDLDHRVLGLASLEAQLRHPNAPLAVARVSALEPAQAVLRAVGAPEDGVDGIVTNPPFGAVDLVGSGTDFKLAMARQTPIEVLGLEQCFNLLRPGGRLGIVLPQSVLTNKRLERVRFYLREEARIDGVLSLPSETFAIFAGVGKASVLFATKTGGGKSVWFGRSTSIGWDTTGREMGNEDIRSTATRMRRQEPVSGLVGKQRLTAELDRNLTAEWQLRIVGDGIPLSELADKIYLGRTPARAAYCDKTDDDALRVVKVGTLTGHGVNWTDGDRSYGKSGRVVEDRLLRVGDIALTAAAHHPRYIGAKVDVIDMLPAGWEGRCMPAGEVLVIRVRPGAIEPTALLLWLRSEEGRAAIQSCITGQTAHLHPDYVAEIRVPRALAEGDFSASLGLLAESLAFRRRFEALEVEAVRRFAEQLGLHESTQSPTVNGETAHAVPTIHSNAVAEPQLTF